jgi:hypothetical protein
MVQILQDSRFDTIVLQRFQDTMCPLLIITDVCYSLDFLRVRNQPFNPQYTLVSCDNVTTRLARTKVNLDERNTSNGARQMVECQQLPGHQLIIRIAPPLTGRRCRRNPVEANHLINCCRVVCYKPLTVGHNLMCRVRTSSNARK